MRHLASRGQKSRKEKETQRSQSSGWVDSLVTMPPNTSGQGYYATRSCHAELF